MPPFARGKKTELACKIVLEDVRPSRPWDRQTSGLTDKVWQILLKCWEKKPSARPPVDAVSACLEQAAETWHGRCPPIRFAEVEQVMNLKEDEAKDFADRLDEERSCEIQSHFSLGVLI